GLATLLLQGAYVYRAQLANHLPQLRPVLESACARLGCSVPYDRRIEAIAITGSALRASISTPAKERAAEAQEGVSQLTLDVTLRNRSEEHTSELQSRENLVCRLLLEKKTTSTKTSA